MTKFKVGDEIRRIKNPGNGLMNIGDKAIVTRIGTKPYDGWPYTRDKDGEEYPHNPENVELVTPTTFEVGKKYKSNRSGRILTCLAVYNDNGWLLSDNNEPSTYTFSAYKFAEYIPPPPEEWRALYSQEPNRPEISSAYWSSKEDCDRANKGTSKFMYAIRTDINAKENK